MVMVDSIGNHSEWRTTTPPGLNQDELNDALSHMGNLQVERKDDSFFSFIGDIYGGEFDGKSFKFTVKLNPIFSNNTLQLESAVETATLDLYQVIDFDDNLSSKKRLSRRESFNFENGQSQNAKDTIVNYYHNQLT